ncbi:PREDICTED: sodium/potassium-transporting ATPase subunit beta-like [Ceratosolen solmsi marchali]|uniref:Sodium/potassium-transporting ATPase subunit beta-like n=1 Tax=Ceratosolen solmsi marchali TaxID=326594 RepID=A0AAJ7E089_9HYME|nr:PREDICTED: sodium/potassium-transporting ATPase subunit beta-like [Ceratosolen solmsi marchali]
MIKHDEMYYNERKPVPNLGVFKNFQRFLWNPEKKSLLGRNKEEWAQVCVFYMFFFGGLILLTSLQLWITYMYVSSFDKPFYEYSKISPRTWLEPNRKSMFEMSSLNSHGPGIVLKPNIIPNSKPPLILIDESHKMNKVKKYVTAVKKMLSEYNVDQSKFDIICNNSLRNQNMNKACYFDIQTLGQCSKAPYGYTWPPQPCVYIRFNKRFGWMPIFYNQAFYLPKTMPQWLQKTIQKSDKFYVWLSCEGVSNNDTVLMGEIDYLPSPGFPIQYFPFFGQIDYHTPIVALQFKNLTVNQLINIECKAWAQNIDNENRYNLDFRILIKNLEIIM